MEYKFTNGSDNDFAILCEELDASIDELVVINLIESHTPNTTDVMIFEILL
jgi:hypothetical protein